MKKNAADILEAWSSNNNEDSVGGEEATEDISEELDNIFDPSILQDLDISNLNGVKFNPPIENCLTPGADLRLRPLQIGDFSLGFLQLLTQLTKVGDISEDQWQQRFVDMKKKVGTYYVMVVEDRKTQQVVGATTLLVEQKFIHECSQVGRVEDVVVSDKYRGRQLGKFLVAVAILLAQKLHCYKVTLNCTDSMLAFYSGLGFKCEEGDANFMVIRL